MTFFCFLVSVFNAADRVMRNCTSGVVAIYTSKIIGHTAVIRSVYIFCGSPKIGVLTEIRRKKVVVASRQCVESSDVAFGS